MSSSLLLIAIEGEIKKNNHMRSNVMLVVGVREIFTYECSRLDFKHYHVVVVVVVVVVVKRLQQQQ